jgi:hypothetical protein
MRSDSEARVTACLAAVISGAMLAGTSGLTLVVGWTLLVVGLTVVLAAIPPAGDRPRGGCGERAAYAARSLRGRSAAMAQRA